MRAEQPTKLCKPRRKMRVKVGAQKKKRFKTPPTSNYYWPSQGGTFVVLSVVLCSVLFNF